MNFSTIVLFAFVILLGMYFLALLDLNKTVINLDLIFLELDIQLGYMILISMLVGIFITLVLEIIFFSSKHKNRDE